MFASTRIFEPGTLGALGLVTGAVALLWSSNAAADTEPEQLAQSTSPPLESGGMQPPPPNPSSAPPPSSSSMDMDLDRAEQRDSGRGLEFVWLNTEFGFQSVNLQTFKANDVVDAEVVAESASGLMYGAGVGLRLVFLTAGARFRLATMDAWDLWSLDAEAGLKVQLGNLEPYFTLAAGYTSIGAFSLDRAGAGAGVNPDSVDISGFNVRLASGLDWYLSEVFSIGANVAGEGLFVTRNGQAQSADMADEAAAAANEVYSRDGDGIGFGFSATAVAGLHF